MNIGQNILNLFVDNAGPLALVGVGCGAIYLLYKRKVSEFIGLLVCAVLAFGFVYSPATVKDFFVGIFNRIITGIS